MKIVVAYKWAPNPQDATVAADGTVDWRRAKAAISEYDPVAIEVGRRLADATGGELVGVTVGPTEAASSAARKAVMSRGLDSLVAQADDSLAGLGTLQTAKVLAGIVRDLGDVAVVLTGDSSVDVGAKLVGPTLAGCLGWPCLTNVTQVEASGGTLSVERAWQGGRQSVDITGPAVLACSTDAALPRIPGIKDMMAAAKKPVEELAPADVGGGTTEVVGRSKPELKARKGHVVPGTDPAGAAAEVVAALRRDGVI